jgi:hypothetical protein
MYTHHSISLQVANNRKRDLLAEAERARLARQAVSVTRVSQPPARRRSARRLIRQLLPQAQS